MSLALKLAAALGGASGGGGGGYRYLRLVVHDGNGIGYAAISEIDWMVGATDYPTGAMTTNTAPSPLVASSSSIYSEPYDAWRAFNNVPGYDYFNPAVGDANSWLQIDLGAGNEITPTGLGFTPLLTYWARSFTCYGSTTGAFAGEETLLYTYNGGDTGWYSDTRRDFVF